MDIKAYTIHTMGESHVLIEESAGCHLVSERVTDLLEFLLDDDTESIHAVWNLDSFAGTILKLTSTEICQQLIGPTHQAVFGFDGSKSIYTVYYLPHVLLSITKKEDGDPKQMKVTIYGLDGFFDDDEPEPADVYSLKKRGDKMLTELGKIGIFPKTLTSPVGAFLSTYKLQVPTMKDTPEQHLGAQLYAEECTGKEWREAFKIGCFAAGESYSYDLSCAYGSVAARLPDIRYARYIYSTEMIDSAYLGFVRGTITINHDTKISPIITRMGGGRLINPTGTWDGYLTLDEVRFIERYQIGSFKLRDGWFLVFKPFACPLQQLMELLYAQRTQSDPILNIFLKRVASGICGKFHEHHESGPGDFFNPIFHAVITATVRLKVAELVYQNDIQNNVIRINTDGLLVDRELDIPKSRGMGRWRFVDTQPAIVLSPELLFTKDKHPNGMNHSLLLRLIFEKPRARLYEAQLPKRVTLSEALRDHHLERVGENTTRSSRIDLTLLQHYQTRSFHQFPQTGENLLDGKYDSEPIRLGEKADQG